jgi:hypothetical protein
LAFATLHFAEPEQPKSKTLSQCERNLCSSKPDPTVLTTRNERKVKNEAWGQVVGSNDAACWGKPLDAQQPNFILGKGHFRTAGVRGLLKQKRAARRPRNWDRKKQKNAMQRTARNLATDLPLLLAAGLHARWLRFRGFHVCNQEEELLKHCPSIFPESCTDNVHPAVCRPSPPQPLLLEPTTQPEERAGKTKAFWTSLPTRRRAKQTQNEEL